jgi:hypothetical protein
MSDSTTLRTGWLFGAGWDLMLGCGLGSMAVMLAQAASGPSLERLVPGGLLVLLFALPHYGATLIRAYEDPADRAKYRVFTVWATLLVVGCLVAGLHLPLFGSLVLTLYLTWSPWHYTGQNYGIALMLLARRGVAVSSVAKRFFYVSFVLSYLLTFLAIHGQVSRGTYAPVSYGGTVFELLPIGFPHSAMSFGIVGVGAAYAVACAVAIVLLARAGGLRAIVPALILMSTQALWFSLPVAIRHFELAGETSAFRSVYTAYGFLWIAGYHAIQYLWITTYYATRLPGPESGTPLPSERSAVGQRLRFLGKAALLGYAVWTVPALVLAPGLLSSIPHESGLALMVAAAVNLHHFVLDGAIWKLRDGRVARILLKVGPRLEARVGPGSEGEGGRKLEDPPLPDEQDPSEGVRASSWPRRLIYGVGIACAAYGALTYVGGDLGFGGKLSRGDTHGARVAMERLKWLGRDGPSRHTELGRRLAGQGETLAARREFERSIELSPTARAWESMAKLFEQQRQWQRAAVAYDSALALQPEVASTLFRLGRAWLEAGYPQKAIAPLERAAALAPGEKIIGLNLARARRELEARSNP